MMYLVTQLMYLVTQVMYLVTNSKTRRLFGEIAVSTGTISSLPPVFYAIVSGHFDFLKLTIA